MKLPPAQRWLIVNADDLGLSAGTNRGIFHAHEHGIVTSASLMVRRAAAREAVEISSCFPRLSLGLHVDLGDWSWRDGQHRQTNPVVSPADVAGVEAEIRRQLERFEQLIGRGPTHLDSHQHVHRDPLLRPVFRKIAGRLKVPLRNFNPHVAFCGDFYGQDNGRPRADWVAPANLCRLIQQLPPGVTELACHPGLDAELDSDYREQRPQEVQTLCHPAVRAELERGGILLRSFGDLQPVAK